MDRNDLSGIGNRVNLGSYLGSMTFSACGANPRWARLGSHQSAKIDQFDVQLERVSSVKCKAQSDRNISESQHIASPQTLVFISVRSE